MKLQDLFNLLKKNGALGIAYEPSEGRKPKTPNEVLTPEKDGVKRADCDEFSRLFFTAAGRLNIDVSDIGIGVMKFETKDLIGNSREEMHAAVLTVGNDKYLVDPVFGFFQKVPSFEINEIEPLYHDKSITERFKITGILNFVIASTSEQIAAIHYREAAKYHENKAKSKSGAAKEKELALMDAEVRNGLLLDPGSKLLKELKCSLVHSYLDIADEYMKNKDASHAMQYANKATAFYTDSRLDENERIEFCHAFNLIGTVLHLENKPLAAIGYFEIAITIRPGDAIPYGNAISSLLQLLNSVINTDTERAKGYFSDARKIEMRARSNVPDAENQLKDAFSELERIGKARGW